ncbi:MAG: Jag N-terminal domain-containing protein [Candidatus Aminicenantes bacterium]|nr:Jag N-terminal domain-containing protein [Candidatus Aminicenantes bacterium]
MGKNQRNNEVFEFRGRNLDEALSNAEHNLKLPRDKISFEVVTEKTKLFGFKGKEIVIRAWPKESNEAEGISTFLQKFLTLFPLELSFEVKKKNNFLYLVFDGPDRGLLLRQEGALLLAIQHILNKISDRKIQVDCDFFRRKKERKLRDIAERTAQKVLATGHEEILEPMNPYERRIIHLVVNEIPGLSTESLGEGFYKKVRIYPLKT